MRIDHTRWSKIRFLLVFFCVILVMVGCKGGSSTDSLATDSLASENSFFKDFSLGRAAISMKDSQALSASGKSLEKKKPTSNPSSKEEGNIEHIFITVREVQLIRDQSDLSPEAVIVVGPKNTRFDLMQLVENLKY